MLISYSELCPLHYSVVHSVCIKTKLMFRNCKNNVIAIVITTERIIFMNIMQLIIMIIRNVIMYVAICYVVISLATYIPIALYISEGFLALHCQLLCKLLDSY